MSSRPWDVRLRQVTWQPVPTSVSVRTRVRIMALLGLPPGGLVLRLAAQPGPDRHALPVRPADRRRALQHRSRRFGFWWTCAQRAGAQAEGAEPAAWPSTCSCPSTRSRSEIVDLTVAAAAGLRGAEVRVWVLDDGNDDAMRDLAARHGVGYIRRDEHTGAKAGQHQQRAHADRRAVHRGLRLRPRGGPALPRGHARLHGRSRDRVRPDAAVLRERATRTASPPRRGRSRRSSSARSPAARTGSTPSSAAAPTCCSAARRSRASAGFPTNSLTEDYELSIWLHEKRLEVGLRAGRALARPRPGGHGRLRLPAAALGARLPVGAPAGAAGEAAVASSRRSTCCRPRTSCRAGRC